MNAAEYTRATAALSALEEMRAALCKVDSALDEMTAHAADVGTVRAARDAVGYVTLDAIDVLIARETERRDAAEQAMRAELASEDETEEQAA